MNREDPALPSVLSIMLATGLSIVTFGTVVDLVAIDLKITDSLVGSIASGHFFGMVIGMLLSAKIWKKNSHIKALHLCALISGITTILFSLSLNYTMAVFLFTLNGIANGIIFTYINTFVSFFSSSQYRSISITKVYILYGIGTLAGPFISQILLNFGVNWRVILQLVGSVTILSSVWIISDKNVVFFLREKVSSKGVDSSDREKKALVDNKRKGSPRQIFGPNLKGILALVGAIVFSEATDSSLKVWLVKFFRDVHLNENAGFVLTAMWIVIVLTRIILQRLTLAGHIREFIIFSSLFATLVLIGGAITRSVFLAFLCYIGVGIGYSGIYPFLLALIADVDSSNPETLMSLVTSIGAIGAVISPALIGLISDYIGFREGMFAISFFTLCICVLTVINSKSNLSHDKASSTSIRGDLSC